MNIGWIVGAVLCVLLTIGVFAYALSVSKNEKRMQDKLKELHSSPEDSIDLIEDKLSIKDLPLLERTLNPYKESFAKKVKSILPENFIKEIDQKIIVAGNPKGMTTATFLGDIGIKGTLIPVVFAVLLAIIMKNILLALGVGLGMSAFMVFASFSDLNKAKQVRQKYIVKKLPFALDLLTISVDAGLGFDSAIDKVTQNMDGPISDEFKRLLSEMKFGKARKDALREMVVRTQVEELSEFVVAIIQADRLGIGLSKLLKIQAKQMRVKARQKAQEIAQKAPIKMLFPMVMFIFPAIFIVLLAPAGFMVIDVFSSGII